MAHTPGPWRVDGSRATTVITASWADVANCRSVYFHAEMCAANARLVAAAPDMEEGMAYFIMLSVRLGAELPGDIVSWAKGILVDKPRSGVEVARAAIARATGEVPT